MSAVMDIVISAQDQASDVIEGIGDQAGETGSFIEENWGKITAVTAGAGAAMEGFARKQAPTNESIARLSAQTGESTEEIRALGKEMSNVTFPIDEVFESMEVGRQQGLESTEQLQKFATMWDTVGDATGESGPKLAKQAVALRAVGIEAGNDEEALAALGFITEETTSSAGEFLNFLDRTGPELRNMNADVDDAAAIMGVLESELGMSGRTARSEFRAAISESDGTMEGLLDTLGVSADQFDEYRGKVGESSDVIQRNADIHAESFTPMQKLQHGAEELMLQYGALADVAGMAAPVLIAIGPIMKGLSVATSGLSKAMTFLAANPIVLVIVLVAALAAGLVIAYQKSETFRRIVDGAFRAVGSAASWVWNRVLKPVFDAIGGAFSWIGDQASSFGDLWDGIMSGAGKAVQLWLTPYKAAANAIAGGLEGLINAGARAINSIPSVTIPSWVPVVGGNTFSIPHIPSVSLPRFHEGGTFRADQSGGEGLAMLRDRERIRTPEQEDRLEHLLGRILETLQRGGGGITIGEGGSLIGELKAWTDMFDLGQLEDELAFRGAV